MWVSFYTDPPLFLSSLPLRAAWKANSTTTFADEEPEALGRSPPHGDLTPSMPRYLPEPLASSSVKGGSGHPSWGCCEDQ